LSATPTLGAVLQRTARALRDAGLPTPMLDARLLVQAASGAALETMMARPETVLADEVVRDVERLTAERLAGRPVARLLGRREFWGLDFQLDPATLVPRPDSETLVAAALESIAPEAPARILDLGTGTGCLLLALLSERPRAWGVGVDLSPAAARMAARNAARLGLGRRAHFVCADWGAALRGPFHLVLANPPYIGTGDLRDLQPEVRLHDPPLALDGGADGLDAYRAIVGDLARLLAPGGLAVLELGAGQAAQVAPLARDAGLALAGPPRRDLAGIERALCLTRP
jgi:release factor glutamine methyltransferase